MFSTFKLWVAIRELLEDYLAPNPVKFLTVKSGTRFIFRALVPKTLGLVAQVEDAFKEVLETEGVDAKTAVGYGRFDIITSLENDSEVPEAETQKAVQAIQSPLKKLLNELNLIKSTDMGRIGTIIQKIDILETDAERGKLARAIKDKVGKKAFKKHKRKAYLLELIEKGDSENESQKE